MILQLIVQFKNAHQVVLNSSIFSILCSVKFQLFTHVYYLVHELFRVTNYSEFEKKRIKLLCFYAEYEKSREQLLHFL